MILQLSHFESPCSSRRRGCAEIAPGLLADEIDQIAHGHFHIDQMQAKRLRQVPLNVAARRTVRTTVYRHLEIRGERIGPAPRLQQTHDTHHGRRNGSVHQRSTDRRAPIGRAVLPAASK